MINCIYCKYQVFENSNYYCKKYKKILKRNEIGKIYSICMNLKEDKYE